MSQTEEQEASAPDTAPAAPGAAEPGAVEASTAESATEHSHEDALARRRRPEVRTVDFSQPTKFTAELRRRILRVLGPFCEAFALRLSTELRAPVELALGESSQLTWSAAKAQLSAETIAVALDVAPVERQMLLCVEPPLVLQALECLLGGSAAQAPAERRLSEIDWALTRRLLRSLVTHLNPTWRDLGGLELTLGEVDLEGDAGVVAPLGEPTFALTLESRIDGLPSSMSLLIPWSAIEPVAEDVLGGGAPAADADPDAGAAVQRGLAGAHVCLRAEIGALQMPVERMLALTPGTLLDLGESAQEGVRLFAEGVPLGRARPGLRGTRRAIKLTEPIDPGTGVIAPSAGVLAGSAAAIADIQAAAGGAEESGEAPAGGPAAVSAARLQRMLGVPVRVWAELGRTTLALGHALELPPGSVVELDQAAEAPIELFANGLCFAHGTLQVSGEGQWAVQIDALT